MKRRLNEGMEFCVSGVNIRFDNPNVRMEEV